jgi:hypothetical protein
VLADYSKKGITVKSRTVPCRVSTHRDGFREVNSLRESGLPADRLNALIALFATGLNKQKF